MNTKYKLQKEVEGREVNIKKVMTIWGWDFEDGATRIKKYTEEEAKKLIKKHKKLVGTMDNPDGYNEVLDVYFQEIGGKKVIS